MGITALILAAFPAAFVLSNNTGDNPEPAEPNQQPISQREALNIINNCGASGTYSLHSGELGLVLKPDGRLQPVIGTSEESLRQNQNPDCPFGQRLIE